MTLPTDIIFPLRLDFIKTGDQNGLEIYLRDLTETLTQMYSDMSQNINGAIRIWEPKVYGMTTEGVATYVRQGGWLRRSGIITELWFDVSWSAHTGTGNLELTNYPFTSIGTANYRASGSFGWVDNVALTANNVATVAIVPSVNKSTMTQYPAGGGAATAVAMDTAGNLHFSITYQTA